MTKKIIIIIISILSIASVLILGIYAAAIGQTIGGVKVTGVTLDKSDVDADIKAIKISGTDREYQLVWTVLPVDDNGVTQATTTDVTFSSNNPLVTVSDEGLVKFPDTITASINVTIEIKTRDQNKTDTIDLYYYYKASGSIDD